MRQFDTFSSAIRFGATLRPQAFGTFYDPYTDATCANGAALEAIYERPIVASNLKAGEWREISLALYRSYRYLETKAQLPCDCLWLEGGPDGYDEFGLGAGRVHR